MQTHRGIYSRGYLPHIDLPDTIQHVRFHLAGALPAHALRLITQRPKEERPGLADEALDQASTRVRLRDYEADVVEAALLYFDGVRYDLLAWVVMPNHVHICFQQSRGWPLAKIVQSWKRHSGRRVNATNQSSGKTWEKDYFDRAIRTEEQLRHTLAYIEGNPVKARLVGRPTDWRWSSAWNNRTRWPVS